MEVEDGGATPIPEEDRGLTMEDVFGMSEEEDMLGDPEVEHAEVTEDANGGLGFDMVAGGGGGGAGRDCVGRR